MICPKCKIEYREGYTRCTDCGEALVDTSNPKQNETRDGLFKFGEMTAKRAVSALFFLGLFPLLFASVLFGNFLYLNNTFQKGIWYMQEGQRWYTEKQVNNLPLGILGGIVFFIVMTLAWKMLCELLIIIFRAIETYTQKNKVQ